MNLAKLCLEIWQIKEPKKFFCIHNWLGCDEAYAQTLPNKLKLLQMLSTFSEYSKQRHIQSLFIFNSRQLDVSINPLRIKQ
uniref:Uncharacterized protein n=1 Tax=Rhizophora mucronata TaxID=61149 RepID=A0A2P2R334_RHIMU